MMVTLDATRATAVLNAAMQGNMFPQGAIPEGDKDKISEAEKIVTLALQSKTVADQIGHGNVPLWPIIAQVLMEAGIDPNAAVPGEAESAPSTPDPASAPPQVEQAAPVPEAAPAPPPPAAAPPADMQHMANELGTAVTGSSFVDPPGTEWRAEPGAPAPVQVNTTPPQADTPPPAASSPAGSPQTSEVWVDASGNQWTITNGGGGPQVEVESMATKERTTVPSGFLKQRVASTPTQELPTSPSPSQPQQQSASSLPPSPPPVPAPAMTPVTETSSEHSGSALPEPSQQQLRPSSSSSSTSSPEPDRSEDVDPIPVYDDEGDEEYGDLMAQVAEDYRPKFMPVPMDLSSPPSSMPEDLTLVDDIPARAFHSQFNALASRTRYLMGIEDAYARACARIRRKYLHQKVRELRQDHKSATLEELKAIAEAESADVATWTERETRHTERAEAYKTFLSMYSENVSVLSRDWTMRDREEKQS